MLTTNNRSGSFMRRILVPFIVLAASIFTLNAQETISSSSKTKVSKRQQKKDKKAKALKAKETKNASDSLIGKKVFLSKNADGTVTVVTEEEAIRRGIIVPAPKK